MLNMRRIHFRHRPVFKLASRLMCLLVLLTAAGWLTTTSKAVGDRISCSYDLGGGAVLIVSCGSSAGNVVWQCDNGSCTSNPGDDFFADILCPTFLSSGCIE